MWVCGWVGVCGWLIFPHTPGGIAVSRSLGDASMKLPGYVSAQAEFSHYQIGSQDQFIVLACDGLWDVFSNQEVVDIVLAVWVHIFVHKHTYTYTHILGHARTHTHTHILAHICMHLGARWPCQIDVCMHPSHTHTHTHTHTYIWYLVCVPMSSISVLRNVSST
jgi:hypothetical protein